MNNLLQFFGFAKCLGFYQHNQGLVQIPQGGATGIFSEALDVKTYPPGENGDIFLRDIHIDGVDFIMLNQMR